MMIFRKKSRLLRPCVGLCSIAFCAFLMGCIPIPEPDQEEEEPEVEAFYFESLGLGSRNTTGDTTEVVIHDAETWALYQEQFTPPFPYKPVDFSQGMVALVAVPTESGGYSVMVESVEREDSTVTIRYVINEPGQDCMTTMAEAMPFQAVVLPPIEGPFVFEHRVEPMLCEL